MHCIVNCQILDGVVKNVNFSFVKVIYLYITPDTPENISELYLLLLHQVLQPCIAFCSPITTALIS